MRNENNIQRILSKVAATILARMKETPKCVYLCVTPGEHPYIISEEEYKRRLTTGEWKLKKVPLPVLENSEIPVDKRG